MRSARGHVPLAPHWVAVVGVTHTPALQHRPRRAAGRVADTSAPNAGQADAARRVRAALARACSAEVGRGGAVQAAPPEPTAGERTRLAHPDEAAARSAVDRTAPAARPGDAGLRRRAALAGRAGRAAGARLIAQLADVVRAAAGRAAGRVAHARSTHAFLAGATSGRATALAGAAAAVVGAVRIARAAHRACRAAGCRGRSDTKACAAAAAGEARRVPPARATDAALAGVRPPLPHSALGAFVESGSDDPLKVSAARISTPTGTGVRVSERF